MEDKDDIWGDEEDHWRELANLRMDKIGCELSFIKPSLPLRDDTGSMVRRCLILSLKKYYI